MVLFYDIVEILDLADLDGRLTPGVHGMQPGQIGTTLVDGYRVGRAILIDGLFRSTFGPLACPAWLAAGSQPCCRPCRQRGTDMSIAP